MRKILLLLLISLSGYVYSQIQYEEGYYINNSDERIECLIQNKDWALNPAIINYKLSKDGVVKKGSVHNIKEFSVYNYPTYKRFTLDIDRTSDNVRKLDLNRRPIFNKETLFLKVLVEGEANLFLYLDDNGGLKRFFYQKIGADIQQLVYKRYLAKNADDILKNDYFRQQLRFFLECETIDKKHIEEIEYIQKDIVDLFIKYNQCEGNLTKKVVSSNPSISINPEKTKKKQFNFSFFMGARNSKYILYDNDKTKKYNFGNKTGLNVGFELEYVFPFNKNKWAVFTQPTYQYYKPEAFIYKQSEIRDYYASMDYKSIEFPLGIRYYLNIKDNMKLFFNSALVLEKTNSAMMILESKLPFLSEAITAGINLGAGVKISERFNGEINYGTGRDVFHLEIDMDGNYQYISANIKYTLI